MKLKTVLLFGLCIVAVIFPSLVFCESPADRLARNVPSAHIWEKFSIAHKTILIGGLLVGYRAGIAKDAASEHRRLKNNRQNSRAEADRLIEKAQGLFYNPISFYVRQTDSFLQTFPECKNMEITKLLDQLASVGGVSPLKEVMGYDFIRQVDYEDIEKECLKGLP